jgi:uncharacterized protein (TIGR02145 family)
MPGTVVTFTATEVNCSADPIYQWEVNNVNVGIDDSAYSYTPLNNDNIKCVVTSLLDGDLVTTSNTVNMIVYSTGTACTGVPTVVHGGMTYNTVQIGTQCWLRENINYGTKITATTNQSNNSIVEKYCYSNSDLNCNVYGGLYQWAEMVQYYNNVTNTTHWATPYPTVVQGVCPSGWHIPTNTEANTLITILGGQSVAGGRIKEVGTVHWNSVNVGATNSSGFTALPNGGRNPYGVFMNGPGSGPTCGEYGDLSDINNGSYGFFWTITKGATNTDIYYYGASYNFVGSNAGQSYKVAGKAVRCLKD